MQSLLLARGANTLLFHSLAAGGPEQLRFSVFAGAGFGAGVGFSGASDELRPTPAAVRALVRQNAERAMAQQAQKVADGYAQVEVQVEVHSQQHAQLLAQARLLRHVYDEIQRVGAELKEVDGRVRAHESRAFDAYSSQTQMLARSDVDLNASTSSSSSSIESLEALTLQLPQGR